MRKLIWKYVMLDAIAKFTLPADSTVLTAQEQDGNIAIWIEVPQSNEILLQRTWHFAAIPTGGTSPNEIYINTVRLAGGLVFHIYHD